MKGFVSNNGIGDEVYKRHRHSEGGELHAGEVIRWPRTPREQQSDEWGDASGSRLRQDSPTASPTLRRDTCPGVRQQVASGAGEEEYRQPGDERPRGHRPRGVGGQYALYRGGIGARAEVGHGEYRPYAEDGGAVHRTPSSQDVDHQIATEQ